MASRRVARKRVSVAAVAGDCFSNRFQGPVNGAESRKYNRPEARLPLRFQGCRTASRRCRAMPSPALIREADGDVPPPVVMPGRHEFRPRMHFLFRFHAASRLRPLRGGEASSAGNGAMRGMRQRATRGRGGARSDGGGRRLVVVESPAKARTIGQFLGGGYRVMATRGHVRDLPAKAGSVKPEDGFAMVYETGRGAARTPGAMAKALRRADALVLATDPDREGEAIAWQVLSGLRKQDAVGDRAVHQVAFHEVTPAGVRTALARPRNIDMDLVEAWQARRALDDLVGYGPSPVLWRQLPGCRSAGRVQSVALLLICEDEAEIEAFAPRAYWTVTADATATDGATLASGGTSGSGARSGRNSAGSTAPRSTWPGLAAQRLPRFFAAPVRAGFERMRRGHGFALQ